MRCSLPNDFEAASRFWGELSDWWLGVCNAVAAGMMMAASYNLVMEGCALDSDGAALFGIGIPIMLRATAPFCTPHSHYPVPQPWAAHCTMGVCLVDSR